MQTHKRRILKIGAQGLVALECAVIVLLAMHVYRHYRTRFAVSVSPLARENLSFPQGNLNYFYEPTPGSIDTSRLPAWLPQRPLYTINTDSLNDRFDYTPTKPGGVYRIVTLGDSFTYGLFVNTAQNWTEILENTLNKNFVCRPYKKFEVINLGYTGYDIRYGVERYKRRGEKYNPDLVIWFLKQDDFDDISEWENARIETYEKEARQNYAAVTEADALNFLERSRKELLKTFSPQQLAYEQTENLRALDTYFRGDLLVYSLSYVFKSSLLDNESIVEHFTQTRPYTYFYMSEKNLRREHETFPDNHPNTKGHAFIAGDILKYLTENGVIPCKNENAQ